MPFSLLDFLFCELSVHILCPFFYLVLKKISDLFLAGEQTSHIDFNNDI